jgi:hypothetical protein
MTLKITLLFLAASPLAFADPRDEMIRQMDRQMNRMTHCRVGGTVYAIYPGVEGMAPDQVRLIREALQSELPGDKTPEFGMARWAQASGSLGEFHLPSYWTGPKKLSHLDCADIQSDVPAIGRRMMMMHGYFTAGRMPQTSEELEEMLKNCDAFPIDFRIICHLDGVNPGIAGCTQITLLDEKFPVDSGCRR